MATRGDTRETGKFTVPRELVHAKKGHMGEALRQKAEPRRLTAKSKQDLWASAFPGVQDGVHKKKLGGDCSGTFVSYQVMVRAVQRGQMWPDAPGCLGRLLTTCVCVVQEERGGS